MQIAEKREPDTWTLYLSGELDLTGGPELAAYTEGKLSDVETLILDMTDVRYMSSAGIRAVLNVKRALGRNTLRITGCNAMVYEVFELTGLDSVFEVEKAE